MKVDTSRLKKGTSEVPPECQNLIDKLKCCNRFELIEELSQIEAWTFGKCELYHWIDILDIFDEILEDATRYEDNQIYIHCDAPSFDKGRKLLLLVLNFTTLLIEHSFSRHLYNSVEYLTQLLLSTDLEIILGVLNLLYMFSKRSNFISRLSCHKKNTLLSRLKHIAEPYGGKECGFGLADCCRPDQQMPKEIYHFYYEYYTKNGTLEVIDYQNISKHDPKTITLKFWQELDSFLDDDQKYHLFARARLATGFWNYENRILFVQARLQALSILVYSDALLGYTSTLIYPGFLEELVELLELQQPNLVEIRAAALRTLTAIIHLERNSQYQRKSESRLNTIIEVTGAASYHGFLPTLVRNCIANLTGMPNNNVKTTVDQHSLTSEENLFPLQLATALFSFLYHLASYEPGAESLVSCGMMESLLRVINWSGTELEHITFVTRAVRVIDLITNLDMQSFQLNNGLNTFIKRLNLEVNLCRKEQSYEIKPNIEDADKNLTHMDETMDTGSQYGDDDIIMTSSTQSLGGISNTSKTAEVSPSSLSSNSNNRTCLPQRAALLKSMLNFLKKAIQDSAFSDSIRHIMEGTLPESLKHIISNSEYYGPSLFLLATDVVTVYVFQEPSLLSSLQDNGLTDVVLQALLKKDVPATREVLGSLPNVFSALCLNTRGLESFVKYNPFEKLFRVLTSPVYLSAMRRRRSSDPMGDTASNIGNAMDELMRNQPSLKTPAIKAIIKLLEEIVELGTDPKYICWRAQNKNDVSPQMPNSRQNNNNNNDNGGSSDEDEDDEEEVSTSSHNNQTNTGTATSNTQTQAASSSSSSSTTNSATQAVASPSASERIPTALIDYTLNTMKFLEAILSNNSTDDHCREFVTLGGLRPLLSILSLPNFPVTSCNSPITATAQAVASVCKSILNLTHEPSVLQVALEQLSTVVEQLQPLQNHMEHTSSSVLLKELANCQDINHAFTNATYTPLLHAMSAVHGYVVMLVYVCRSGQSDIRTLSLLKWGQDNTYGMKLLKKLVMLYTGLVWESTLLLALCTDDIIPPGSEFGKDEMEKLGASDLKNIIEVNWDEIVSNLSVMENLTTNPNLTSSGSGNMDIDGGGSSSGGSLSLRKVKQSQDTSVRFVASQSQLKYIKSLLGASSRLGRALAELFGLLVRLCVGSPLRQRRGQNFPQVPSFTSPASRDIARILSFILVDGLSFSKLPASPVPKLKLTFLICSIGFTSPMLFDEKRYAYHLMLQKFIEEGGLDAFFEMFRWTLTAGYTIPIHRAIEHPNLPDGTGEALDAWLMLLEKMVNIRSIIESPHLITSKSFANRTVKQEFDSKHYLTYMHRHAFNSIQYLWGFKPLKLYGLRMTESMLSILKHIIKGEKVLQLRYLKNSTGVVMTDKPKTILPGAASSSIASVAGTPAVVPAGSSTPAGISTSAGSTTPAAGPSSSRATSNSLDMDEVLFLRRLMDMGFTREHSMEALSHSFTIEQATEYLLLNPLTQLDPISDEEPSAVAPSTVAPPNVPAPMNMDIDAVEEDEQVIRAILNSLGADTVQISNPLTPSAPITLETNASASTITAKTLGEALKSAEKVKNSETKNKQKESIKKYMLEQPLQQKTLDDFTQNLLKTCLNILDQLPETVYKICDLLTSVTKRNGPIWRDEMLDTLCKEIYQCIQYLIQVLVQDDERSSKNYKEKSDKLVSGEMANKTAVRIHLFTLFFQGQYQEMKLPCAIALKIYTIIPRLIKVLTDYQMIVSLMNKVLPTPKWLAPLALLLDLYDKVALSTKHKQVMHKISTRTWQSYNMVSYKWSNYTPEQNKLINDAYMSGESEVRLILGGRFQRCTINFNCMTQINDDETNRPIIMALRSIEAMNNPNVSLDEKAEDEAAAEGELSETPTPTPGISSSDLVTPIPDAKEEGTATDPKDGPVNLMDVDPPAKNYVRMLENIELEPLASFVPEEIVSSCVQLMSHQQLDRDTLHAIMRVVVRLTKNYNMAEVFARFGGIDVLLNMKHNSGYIGFTTLATLLIRHVIEEPKTLSLAIQNVLANRTLTTIPAGHRDLLFLIRQLNSAVYRDPELFKEAALKILRVDFDSMKRSQIDEKRFIMKSVPLPNNIKYNMEHSTAMSAVCKLLKALVEPDDTDSSASGMMWSAAAPTERASGSKEGNRKEKFTATPQPISTEDPKDKTGAMNDKPLLSKSAILKILAEAVRSYQTVALYITEHIYKTGLSSMITEDTTALSFILDKMFHINDANMDRECPAMAQNLISAIASSDVIQAQYTVVHEVKLALQRALNETETAEKHLHIEGLASLIPAMIENNVANNDSNQFFKVNNQPQLRQNIFYIMLEKGIITDIARAVQYLELGGPNTTATINHLLKPLEMLLRLTNEPMPTIPVKIKKALPQRRTPNVNAEDGTPATIVQDVRLQAEQQIMQTQSQAYSEALSNNVNVTVTTNSGVTTNQINPNRSTATHSDSTNAQDEQMLADDSEQNTERDMSSAAIDSLVGENELGDHIGEVHLNEILDTLISEELRGINDYADDGAADADDDADNEGEETEGERRHHRRHMHRDNGEMIVRETLESSSDSGDSSSNPSENDEREMDEVDEIENDEDEEEEEAEERSELDVDEETQPFEMYDHHHHMYGRHLSPSIPEIERDHEDILMIQYSNNGQNAAISNNNAGADRERGVVREPIGANISISVSNNASNANNANEQPQNFLFNANFPLLYNDNSETGPNENSNSAQGAASNVSQEPSTSAINSNAPPNNHPLLSGRPDGAPIANRHEGVHTNETAAVQVARRSQGRPRHYQFINISSRNQPVILQRMLELRQGRNHPPGGNAAQVQGTAQLHDGAGAAASAGPGFYRGDTTRVVVMDNGFSIFSNEDMEIEMVDQSTGYWFGRTLANHLNNLPSALCWWQEENKISGPDSNSDLCMMICEEMIPDLDAARASELSKIRGKRKKKPMEEEEGKQKNQDKKSNDDEETEEVRTQVVTVAPQVAVATTAVAGQSNQGISDSSSSSTSTNAEIIRRLRVEEFERRFTLCSESGSDDSNSNQAANNPVSSSNNLNISFMDVNEEEVTPITITTQTVSPPQHITTDNQLNIDLDVEMASDAEDSASANNSRSFSPNYSPNSNQIEANDMNMLNRATPSDNQQQQVVNNLNIQDNAQPPQLRSIRVPALEVDHPMRGDTDGDDSDDENERRSLLLENAANATCGLFNEELSEALQVPLPTDDEEDDEEDDDEEDELEEEDDGNQEEGAVGGVSENQAAAEGGENDADVVVSIVNDNIDPAIRAILGDIEVPEGIDPSFLAALPAEMRNEVISEHTRQARIRQRAVQTAALQEAQAMADVNPEFLAALPLNIQEEVLAQQRLEQQRQAAATANPNDPVNTAEFFQNLQPSLRQAILTDMEDSQISALPPDLAAEAQNLRRDWETRNRQLLQERILHTSSFSNVIRHNNRSEYNSISRQLRSLQLDALNVLGRIADPRVYVPRHNLLQFSTSGGYALTRAQPPQTTINPSMERQGAPLLDQESLASILVLLFIDDPNISTLRLYRVIRNLCFHVPTRKWIIKSLLSIIMRCNEESMDQYLEPIANTTSGGSTTRSSKVTASTVRDGDDKVKWLKLRLDSALGGRANVFLKKLEKSLGSNINISNVPLTIHPKASPTVCRHTLELLIFLAKSFPSHFLPLRKNINTPNVVDVPNGQTNDVTDEPMPSTSQASMVKEKSFDFWDILLRLDNEIDERTKKGAATGNLKAISKQIKEFNEQDIKTFNESPFGQLIMMLAYDIIRKNSLLTDKLLRLLSLISIMLADNKYKNGSTNKTPAIVDTTSRAAGIRSSNIPSNAVESNAGETQQATTSAATTVEDPITTVAVIDETLSESLPESEEHLSLTVKVLTSKSCSEDGLEDATALLINLSQCSSKTKYMIINLLVEGVISLSHMVQKHINTLMIELKELNESMKGDKIKTETSIVGPSHDDTDNNDMMKPSSSKGQLKDRFTKESVIITAPSKVKTSCDLQLPSMAPLLSKTSNQSFFLRILKVITQIRDTIRQDSKTCDTDIEQQLHKLETVPLSELLNLDALWNTLSGCLKELEETQDHHAVLVLQPAVEAFFIVHSAPQVKTAPPTPPPVAAAGLAAAAAASGNNQLDQAERSGSAGAAGGSGGGQGENNTLEAQNSDNSINNPTVESVNNNSRNSVDRNEEVSANNNNNEAVLPTPPPPSSTTNITPSVPSTGELQSLTSASSSAAVATTTETRSQENINATVQLNIPIDDQENAAGSSSTTNRTVQAQQLSPMDTTQSSESTITDSERLSAQQQSTTAAAVASQNSQTTPAQPLSADQKKFLQFAETHRVVLNQILRQSSTHLADGPFAVLVDHTRVLDFDVKRRYFRIELERLDDGIRREELAVHVHRVNVFEDSFRELYRRNPEEWKNRFYIVFEDEEGQDAGGLLREWYMIISREIFNPMYALFCVSPGDRVTYMINTSSHCNPNHLCYFKFVGRVIAKAIYDNKLLECYFTRSFYKHILGIQVKYTDMESEDYEFYRGLVYLMENTVDTLGYDLTFSLEIQEFGVTEVRELIPNGGNIQVTEQNKLEYIQLVCQLKMSGSIKQQLNAFLEGFYDIIPKRLISIFNEQELELLISGLPNIDIEDLRANTEYHKYQVTSIQIQWFWRALRSFDQAERAKFLQFVTGTSKVPLQGFGSLEGMNGTQKFQIHRDDRSTDRLPSAHTCFNQLDLPVYKSYDKLRGNLLKAIHECSEGFGFA